jgi:hypothetical protein
MGMNITFYKVVENIAQRSGLILERYRTKDMNWILDNNDLRRVRFTPDEYIDGLQGVVKITGTEADALIAENNYQMGYDGLEPNNNNQQEQPQEEQEVEQEEQTETVDEQTEQNDETPENTETETIEGNDIGNVEDILGGGTQQDKNNETSEEETETQQQNQEEE